MHCTEQPDFRTRRNARRSYGFTVVEIVIVAFIIGLLAAVALPTFLEARRSSRVARAERDCRVISEAIELMVWDCKLWPGEQPPDQVHRRGGNEVWDLSTPKAGLMAASEAFENWHGPYLPRVPTDPWGNNYFFDTDYHIDGKVWVVVGSFGPNGVGRNQYDDDNIFELIECR
jgi:general secretion pathway protein G